MRLRKILLISFLSFSCLHSLAMEINDFLAVRSALGYCVKCEDWVEIYYPSKFCPKCGKKILDSWPP